jgi:hypothetical protein
MPPSDRMVNFPITWAADMDHDDSNIGPSFSYAPLFFALLLRYDAAEHGDATPLNKSKRARSISSQRNT